MKLDALLLRARYLALALPLFALTSTIHAGCSTAPNGLYYGKYGNIGTKVPSTADRPEEGCIVYRSNYGGYGGYYGPCDEDDEGYSGYGGWGGYGGYGGYGYGGH
jgi:hypothetical protein